MLGRMDKCASPNHPILMGFSMKHAASLGLEPGAYELAAAGSDNYTWSMLYDYHRRVTKNPEAHFESYTPESEAIERQFLMDVGVNFPADLLAGLRGVTADITVYRWYSRMAFD